MLPVRLENVVTHFGGIGVFEEDFIMFFCVGVLSLTYLTSQSAKRLMTLAAGFNIKDIFGHQTVGWKLQCRGRIKTAY